MPTRKNAKVARAATHQIFPKVNISLEISKKILACWVLRVRLTLPPGRVYSPSDHPFLTRYNALVSLVASKRGHVFFCLSDCRIGVTVAPLSRALRLFAHSCIIFHLRQVARRSCTRKLMFNWVNQAARITAMFDGIIVLNLTCLVLGGGERQPNGNEIQKNDTKSKKPNPRIRLSV
jgi:hypothetical protein